MSDPPPTPAADAPDPAARRDRAFMGIALDMARRGLGRTAPNPAVGAVIVAPASGEILARATTAPGGRPHAEPIAIAAAGSRARGATLYVTLEPCAHHGHTPPCADAIVAAGLARVVCAAEDPDPRVAGRGLDRLRAASIAVTRGVRTAEARHLTAGHICRVTQRRPFVQLKLALDATGAVPRGTGHAPVFVTSPEARALGHRLRAEADAILVGRGTVEADDPELTCRLPGLAARSPRRIVLARAGLQLTGRRIARPHPAASLTVVTGPGLSAAGILAMEQAGARVEAVPVVDGALWLPAILEQLAADGVTRLLVEGGPTVWRAFARAGLVDEVVLIVAGDPGPPERRAKTAGAPDPAHDLGRHLGPWPFAPHDTRRIGPDRVWWLRPA